MAPESTLSVGSELESRAYSGLKSGTVPGSELKARTKIRLTVKTMKTTIPILFVDTASPPCRFVMMTVDLLGIEVSLRHIDLFKRENLLDSYKKVNFLQKVPAMRVDEQTLVDSHAICLYLCEKYKTKSQNIYPQDVIIRNNIHEMLFYNSSTLFPIDSAIFGDFFAGRDFVYEQRKWSAAMEYMEFRLRKHDWLAGDQITICDLCCGATISSLELLIPLSEEHNILKNWMKRLRKQKCYIDNEHGLRRLEKYIQQMKHFRTVNGIVL
ncbi:Glutathione S-transferase E14 [Eumeta japonica]|uniref:Glutathione S-transferase E14 n=1 Tax=Eumeta variegata TaxID=151549 RepID=A0A4C1TII0_EUMVA|nr:Glutathione S-transferase E14 [Eumeta japonica]